MTTIVPAIYAQFRCKADQCRHTCCQGWEIQIDPESRQRYAAMTGKIGQRLQAAIIDSEDGACFRLLPGDRCPFLADSGLCDLITACGEAALCQICADHPRYRNEFTGLTELGLGLSCEAAAALTLHHQPPMTWHPLAGEEELPSLPAEEAALLSLRSTLIALMQDRTKPILHRLCSLCEAVGCTLPERSLADWASFLCSLERLDPRWDAVLDDLGRFPEIPEPEQPIIAEQFTVYLLHRHLPGALLDDDPEGRTVFCAVCGLLFLPLTALLGEVEAARMFSSEVEYSEENLCAFLDEVDSLISANESP